MKLKITLTVLVIFASGAFLGIFLGVYIHHKRILKIFNSGPKYKSTKVLERLTHKLDLKESQIAKIRPEVHSIMQKIHDDMMEHRKKMKFSHQKLQTAVKKYLEPIQLNKFEANPMMMGPRLGAKGIKAWLNDSETSVTNDQD